MSHSNVNDIEKKAQRFDIEANYRNESKTFDLVLNKIFSQADRFRFGRKILGRSKAI
jgi:hypothetical protein